MHTLVQPQKIERSEKRSQVLRGYLFVREEAGTESVRRSGDASNSFAGERGVALFAFERREGKVAACSGRKKREVHLKTEYRM
jgi:hypothetical protein